MRTYTRKRPEHQLIAGVNELCRLCLTKAEDTIPIFTDTLGNVCASLALRIMICVGLEVSQDECLPNNICASCHGELQKYYAFRKKCEVSYQKLKSHLLAVQMKEYKEEIDSIKKQNDECVKADVKMNVEKPDNSIVFMVNMDGTLRMCNKSSVAQEPSSMITRINAEPIVLQKPIAQNNIPIIETINRLAQNNEKVVESNRIVETSLTVTESNKTFSKNSESLIKSNNNLIVRSDKIKSVVQNNKPTVQSNNTVSHSNETVIQSNKIVNETNKIVSRSDESVVKSNNVQVDVELQDPGPFLSTYLSTMLVELGILACQDDKLVLVDNETKTLELETVDGSQVTLQLMEEDGTVENPPSTLEITVENGERTKVAIIGEHTPKTKDGIDGGARVRCEFCGQAFASRSVAARHVRARHARVRPYACQVCGRTFAQKVVCTRHELVHQKTRPFACAVCPKSFTQRSALEAHARAHAPPGTRALQLFRCARCPKVFLYSSGLSRHMMVHNGRVYMCAGCQRTFRDKSSLKRHLRNTKHAPDGMKP